MSLLGTTVGELFWKRLNELGIDTVFGLPGTQTVPLWEALRRIGIRTVLSSSETAAAFAANGYYRTSGKPAVICTIPGPGYTLALTGLAEARHDSAALIHVIALPPKKENRWFRLQDIDHEAIAAPLVKETIVIDNPEHVIAKTNQAWQTATLGEPGPALVIIDDSIIEKRASTGGESGLTKKLIDPSLVEQVVGRIEKSNRITMILGQGSVGAKPQVRKLADQLKAAVIATSSGRGVIADSSKMLVVSDIGMSDVATINDLLGDSDLILALGVKFSHNGSAGFNLKIDREKFVQVDQSDEVLRANYPAAISINGTVEEFTVSLLDSLNKNDTSTSGWSTEHISDIKKIIQQSIESNAAIFPQIKPDLNCSWPALFSALAETYPDDTILVTDSGMHQMVTRSYATINIPNGLVIPADFQSMGFGLPAAIGTAMANPERQVIAVVGDGGLAMTAPELATAVREKLNLTVLVFCDNSLGLIEKQQSERYGQTHAVELSLPNFALLTESYGARYFDYDNKNLTTCAATDGVRVIGLPLVPSAKAAGQALKGRISSALKQILGRA